jgi:hypothetical protein
MRSLLHFPSARKSDPRNEWIGGRFPFPFEIEGSRPDLALWMELPEGLIVGTDVFRPDEKTFAETLRNAMANPAVGSARRPARVRVADPRLAGELRAAEVGLEIVVGPTPELDEAFQSLVTTLSAGQLQRTSFLEGDRLSPEIVAELFQAAEMLYRVAPWKFASEEIVRVDISQFRIDGACLVFIGGARSERGFLLFPSIEGYEAFCAVGEELSVGAEPAEIGSSVLSLTYDKKSEIHPALLDEIKRHKWPVAGAGAYPNVEHRDRSGLAGPLSERDVRTVIDCALAAASFSARNRDLLSGRALDAACESYWASDDVEVRLTYPFEEAESFEPATVRKASVVGRNDPCPCGSGKKYKKCHLGSDETALRQESVHDLDRRLIEQMIQFAARRFGTKRLDRMMNGKVREDGFPLFLTWAMCEIPIDGRPAIDHFLEGERGRLEAREVEWLEGQRRAWLSVWEIDSVKPGLIAMRDLLTGQTRTVHEVEASRSLVARDTVLARVVDHEGASYLCGMYARALTPFASARIVEGVRGRLRQKEGPIPIDRLRGDRTGTFLIASWEKTVGEEDERRRMLPKLTNTDGDELTFIVDFYDIEPGKEAVVKERIAGMKGVDESDDAFHFLRGDTLIGTAIVHDGMLRLETNSHERSAALRKKVERACARSIRYRLSEEKSPLEMMVKGAGVPPARDEPTPEQQSLVREFKERHYRKWIDDPIPALGGKTPRQASRSPRGRAEVDLLLRQIENGEQRLPAAERFDVSKIRKELGI